VGLARDETDSEPLRGAKDPPVVVGGSKVEGGRGPAAQKLRDSQLGRRLDPVAVEGCLIRQGAEAQPVEQLEAVGLVAEQGLDHVDMGLDKTRQHSGALGVEDAGGLDLAVHTLSHCKDPAVSHNHIATKPLTIANHRYHEAIPDQEVSCHAVRCSHPTHELSNREP